MKKLLVSMLVMQLAFAGLAQSVEIPQKDFKLMSASPSLSIRRGENQAFDIIILKSHEVLKSKIKMSISSSVPKGVSIAFDPDKGTLEKTAMMVTVDGNVVPGDYNIIVSGTINYKTKGIILKLTVL